MIRIFTVTAALNGRDPAATTATLEAAADKLARLYPALLGASVKAAGDTLTLSIRVSSRDQWSCSTAARKIGTNMLLRVKIPAEQGTLLLISTAPPATTLTKETGRNVSGHRPRGLKAQTAPDGS